MAEHMIELYALEGRRDTLEFVLEQTLARYELLGTPGLVELLASDQFYRLDMMQPSLMLLKEAWRRYPFEKFPDEKENTLKEMEQLTQEIIEQALPDKTLHPLIEQTVQAMRNRKSSLLLNSLDNKPKSTTPP